MKIPQGLKVQASEDGFRYIGVGESGRGRELAKVPVGHRFSTDIEKLGAADIVPAASGRTVVLVPERNRSDRRAIVLIEDRSGFRGSWHLHCDVLAPPPANFPGLYDYSAEAHEAREARDKLIAERHPEPDPPTSFSAGAKWYSAGGGRIAVIARGRRAQGTAGRMGGGPEYLLVMEPDAAMTIFRTGRLYGQPNRIVLSWDGETLHETPWDEYALRHGDGEAAQEAASW